MKKYAIVLLCFSLLGCASVRFRGTPIIVNTREALNTQLSPQQKNQWALLDIQQDAIPGMSVQRAYNELIKNKTGEKVIVAIIDSGMDIDHPALSPNIWINEDEIPNNNMDDDQNGYIDDRHGWNFLGDSENENYEYVRLQKHEDPDSEAFARFEEKRQKERIKYKNRMGNVLFLKEQTPIARQRLQKALGKEDFSIDEAEALSPISVELSEAIRLMQYVDELGITEEDLTAAMKQYQDALDYHHNLDFEGRSLVGDDPDNFDDQKYGDPHVRGPKEADIDHGTHVGGIVGGRGSANGAMGIAKNVAIMPIRAVPNGDEYDKDIALAIRYAVDNGAKVINASFGKSYSAHPEWVLEAIKYAEAHDVLIVHAAGNDNENVDPGMAPNFPNDYVDGREVCDNLITVGASTWDYNQSLVAYFSNYGPVNVDVFAPGYQIFSTVPNGEYDHFDGTSMAAPNVSGVAAVLRSFYPKYSAKTIKKIILASGVPMYYQLDRPDSDEQENPTFFAQTGKIVNLYNALLTASKQ